MTGLTTPHPYPGRLIIVEGIDGSGKSTQLAAAQRWLASRRATAGASSPSGTRRALVRRSMKRGKKKDLLTPTTFSLLHAVDFADRLTYKIIPPLKAGMIVLADRYVYTAFARDVARGVDTATGCAPSTASRRGRTWRSTSACRSRCRCSASSSGRTKLKYHEAGMDSGSAADPAESFRLFQSRVLDDLRRMVTASSVCDVIDATARHPEPAAAAGASAWRTRAAGSRDRGERSRAAER